MAQSTKSKKSSAQATGQDVSSSKLIVMGVILVIVFAVVYAVVRAMTAPDHSIHN